MNRYASQISSNTLSAARSLGEVPPRLIPKLRRFRLVPSLRTELALAVFALITLLGIAGTVHARLTLQSTTEESLSRRGRGIVSDLEVEARELLQSRDFGALTERMSVIMDSNEDLVYIVVIGGNGQVEASTFAPAFRADLPLDLPPKLLEAHRVRQGDPLSEAVVDTDGISVLDIAMPIAGGGDGAVRVGLSRERIRAQVDDLTRTLLLFTGGVLLSGIAVSYLVARLVTRPLRRLAETARAVGRGDLSQEVAVPTDDEVGRLAVAFNEMTGQLKEKELERSRLLEQLLSAQEEERKRVARELHDEAGQALTSVLLGLNHVSERTTNESLKERIESLRTTTSETIDLMKDLSFALRPSAIDDLGLVSALERYVADWSEKTGISADFFAEGFSDRDFSPTQNIAVYRIIQEALTNAARHSGAKHMSVTLEERENWLVVIAEDDGRGFPWRGMETAARNRSLGLLGMQERATMIGAKLTIESDPGAGTAIFLEVPTYPGGNQDG